MAVRPMADNSEMTKPFIAPFTDVPEPENGDHSGIVCLATG